MPRLTLFGHRLLGGAAEQPAPQRQHPRDDAARPSLPTPLVMPPEVSPMADAVSEPPRSAERSVRLTRGRRGHGLRGPLAPPTLPIRTSRAETFVLDVRTVWDHLTPIWPLLESLELRVEEVPPEKSSAVSADLGRNVVGRARWLAIYRQPVERRSRTRFGRRRVIGEAIRTVLPGQR